MPTPRRLSFFVPLALALAAALPARANEFQAVSEIDGVQAIDLNGDGKKDLVEQTGRLLTIYYFKAPRGYSMKDDTVYTTFTLPDDVAAYTFGDVDGKPGPELIGLTGGGVRAWRFEGGKIVEPAIEALSVATAYEGTILDKPRGRDFAIDLDADGRTDLVVPRKGFFAFYRQVAPGEFELAQKVPIQMDTVLSMGGGTFDNNMARAVSFPKFWLADFDGDHKNDFLYFRGALLCVHQRSAERLFDAAPSRVFDFNKFMKRRRRRKELFDMYREPSPEVADVDGDGRADVAIMLPGKGKVGVFRAAGDKPYTEGGVVALNGWTFRREGIPMLRDLNHDGRPDLVLLNIPQLSLWEILEIFFSRKLEVKSFFYLARPDGSFPVADGEYSATVPLILSVTRDSQRIETPFLEMFGDVNGDGRDDLIVKEKDDELDVHYGTESGVFEKNVGRTIPIRNTRGMSSTPELIEDLDGDGIDDLILYHQDFETKLYILEVVRVKRP